MTKFRRTILKSPMACLHSRKLQNLACGFTLSSNARWKKLIPFLPKKLLTRANHMPKSTNPEKSFKI